MAKHYIEVCDQSFSTSLQLLGATPDVSFVFSALQMAKECGLSHFEALNKDRFFSLAKQKQNPMHYLMSFQENCQLQANLQVNAYALAPFSNNVISYEFIEFFVKAIANNGAISLGAYDILNDMKNLSYISSLAKKEGLFFEVILFLDFESNFFKDETLFTKKIYELLESAVEFDSIYFLDPTGLIAPATIYNYIKEAKKLLGQEQFVRFGLLKSGNFAIASYLAAIEAGVNSLDVTLGALSSPLSAPSLESLLYALKDKDVAIVDLKEKKLQEYSRYLYTKVAQIQKQNNYFFYNFTPFHPQLFLDDALKSFKKDKTIFFKTLDTLNKVKIKAGYAPYSSEISKIYWAQAFLNVLHGPFEIMDEDFSKLLLGYYGHTPIVVDPVLFKKAQESTQKVPCLKEPINCVGQKKENSLKYWSLFLQENGFEINNKNLFLAFLLQESSLDVLQDSSLENLLQTLELLKRNE